MLHFFLAIIVVAMFSLPLYTRNKNVPEHRDLGPAAEYALRGLIVIICTSIALFG